MTPDRRAERRPDYPGRRSTDLFEGPHAERVREATDHIGRGKWQEPQRAALNAVRAAAREMTA